MNSKYPRLLLATALVSLASVCHAATDEDCKGPSSECVPVGGWDFSISIGAGVRTDPVVHESTVPLVVIPHIAYYGEHFFLDDLDVGYTFIDSDHFKTTWTFRKDQKDAFTEDVTYVRSK